MDDTARSVGDALETDPDVERRTREIRRDIEQTRGEMSETIEAIEDRLRPGNIVSSATERVKTAATERVRNMKQTAEQAYDRVRSGAASTGGGLIGEIRRNPIPAAMIGVGAAWLLMRRRQTTNTYAGADYGATRRDWDSSYTPESGYSRGSSYGADEGYTGETRYRQYGNSGYEGAQRMQSQLQRMARENPLMVGAAALLLGSAVGLAIPETEKENEWLGETRDSMVDKAQEMARTTAARAQEAVADLAGDTASRIVGGSAE